MHGVTQSSVASFRLASTKQFEDSVQMSSGLDPYIWPGGGEGEGIFWKFCMCVWEGGEGRDENVISNKNCLSYH